jgi:hypothetical protein
MKATYFKIVDTNILDVPEFSEIMFDIIKAYLTEDNKLKYESYVVGTLVDGVSEEFFTFMDSETTDKLISFFSEYNIMLDCKDITSDIKNGNCELEEFKKQFNPLSECTLNADLVERFVKENMTKDDVLDKILSCGISSLNQYDKSIL